jgi:PKD repeat protein
MHPDAITAIHYSWDFGDPASGALNTSALANPVHLYNDTGFYNVKLTVTDIHNCVSTDSITVKAIGAHPSFMSSDTAGCRPFTARFDASASTDFGGNITSYFWNFIYPTFTAISTVATDTTSHTYNINGFYSVQLITTDNNGCHDTLLRNNYIAVMHLILSSAQIILQTSQVLSMILQAAERTHIYGTSVTALLS